MTEAKIRKYRRGGTIYLVCWIIYGSLLFTVTALQYNLKPVWVAVSAIVGGAAFRYLGYFAAWAFTQWAKRNLAEMRLAGTLPSLPKSDEATD